GGFQRTPAVANRVVDVAPHELFNGRSIGAVTARDVADRLLSSPEGSFVLQNLCKTNVLALDVATGRTIWSRELIGGATFAPLIVANGVLFTADAGGRVRGLNAATGAELFSDRLMLTVPDPNSPGGFVQVGQFITALSLAQGRLYVAHGVPIPGLQPGGVTVYALPPREAGPYPTPPSFSGPGSTPRLDMRSDIESRSLGLQSRGMLL